MPRRQPIRKRWDTHFTEMHRYQLLTGHSYFFQGYCDFRNLNEEILQVMKDDLLATPQNLETTAPTTLNNIQACM